MDVKYLNDINTVTLALFPDMFPEIRQAGQFGNSNVFIKS